MNENFCSSERLVTRANDRESYRLWFEFLKRAVDDSSVEVKGNKYTSWGNYRELSFDTWWRKTGSKVTSLEQQTFVEIVNEVPLASPDLFVRIPAALTTTQAVNQIRAILAGSNRLAVPVNAPLRIRQGAEIRHATFRAYLVAYDAYCTLSKKSGSRRVAGKDLLRSVRQQYAMRSVQFVGGVSKGMQVDPMPSPLYGVSGATVDVDAISDAQAIATVQRYLKKAHEIIRNVADGNFPD